MVSGKLFNHDFPTITADEWHRREAARVGALVADIERRTAVEEQRRELRREKVQQGLAKAFRSKSRYKP